MFVDDVANGWVVAVIGGGEWGSTGVGFGFVLEEGLAVDITSAVSLGGGIPRWVATLAEFGLQLGHCSFSIFSGGADLFAPQELAIWDFLYLFRWMV